MANYTETLNALKSAFPAMSPVACPASATTAVQVTAGATGDYLDTVLIIPTSTSPGTVQIKDGSGTAVDIFVGGASSVTTLHSFAIPLGLTSKLGGWSVICGANVKAVAMGTFS
jgi:hypothetical protein